MKRVLILTASYGDGHNAAAQNLSTALEMICPSAHVAVIDPLQSSYGALNTAARNAYNGIVRYAPFVWSGIYSLLDSSSNPEKRFVKLGRLQKTLGHLLQDIQPDCVVSTYPLYATVIQDLYRDHSERPFPLVTVVTDSVSINSAWLQAPSDIYCVANEATAAILRERGIPASKIKALGFPVSPAFCQRPEPPLARPISDGPHRILYIINTGKKKIGKAIKKLLAVPEIHLTIAVGRNPYLKAKLLHNLARYGGRVQVLGWTNAMPQLMMTHHLLIGKAGGALVQEAIAARCPMIANQVIPGQEEGNAQLLEENDIGVVAQKTGPMVDWAMHAFKNDARLWNKWRSNLERISKPDSALRIAELILGECDSTGSKQTMRKISDRLTAQPHPAGTPSVLSSRNDNKPLLCDFHIHSNYSDGKLSIAELVDFYGLRQFDCICVTDHLADPRRLIGKLGKLARLTLSPHQMDEYFDIIERERRRAWRKYSMLVLTGIEFNKDGLSRKSSAHLLGIDLKAAVPDDLYLPETIGAIHAQKGLAIASHPHIMKSEWGKNTLYLWENQEIFAPLLDAWEVANRNNMFNPVSSMRLPYIANSDFHKPKHIYSWKTLLSCSKSPDAIKDCIRKNEHVAITLYRDGVPAISSFARNDPTRLIADAASGLHDARAVA
jgi:UDP-N-acetylglucosamine:LPS N-acetylglucosamine transferase/predicted metal-dependent phosphoesterase TrpH